jgi:RNA polymerase sigma factor (sigma-70 family)
MAGEDADGDRIARRWALVAAHRDRLLRHARTRSASDADAEDAVQEAMIRSVLFEDLDEERVGPFLTTVTSRICADLHRYGGQDGRLRERLGNRLVDEVSPEEAACDVAEARSVAHVVDGLPARQQSVVRARSQGLSCTEIAGRLGLSYTAVESALARARATVRAKVDICLGATAPACLRVARALSGVPGELPGASVLAIGGLVGGLIMSHPGALPDLATPGPRPAVVAASASGPPPTAPSPTPAPKPARRPAAPLARVLRDGPGAAVPSPSRSPYRVGDVGVGEEHGEYTFEQRVMHCVTEGVEIGSRIECRTPDGDPSPSPTQRSTR